MNRRPDIPDDEREKIEAEIEAEIGFRWTPQMRHAHKVGKVWDALVAVMYSIRVTGKQDIDEPCDCCGFRDVVCAECGEPR